jgi:hypothetical protein
MEYNIEKKMENSTHSQESMYEKPPAKEEYYSPKRCNESDRRILRERKEEIRRGNTIQRD